MLKSLIAFHVNGFSNLVYMITSNFWFSLLMLSMLCTVFLNLKARIDQSINEDQRII